MTANSFAATATVTLDDVGARAVGVYDALGRQVAVLASDPVVADLYEARFDSSTLPSGVYVYRVQAGGAVQTGCLPLAR